MTSPPELRTLQASDAEWLAGLHALCFDEQRRWAASLFAESLANPAVSGFFLTDAEQPVGFILLSDVAGEAEILTLAVAPAFRRNNIAAQLMRHAAEALHEKKAKTIFLEVAIDNIPALRLYHKMGFEKTGLRKNYYQSNNFSTDAVIMRRALPLT